MAEFKLGRIRFVWKGEWGTGTEYYKDDVVSRGGKAYICVIGHVSSADFFTDLDVVPSKWNLIADGQRWQADWEANRSYINDDIVRWGGRLYICVNSHESAEDSTAGLESDIGNWQLFAEGLDWKGDWTTEEDYKVNDFVKYGGITYVCREEHISAASDNLGLEEDQSKWEVFNAGFEYLDSYTPNFRYKKNDVVKYGAGLWISLNGHTSTPEFESDINNWEKFVEGFQFESEWDAYRDYQTGDIVRYGGNQYIAVSDNRETFPTQSESDWQLFSEGLKFVGDWNEDSSQIEYREGEVVRLGGFTYRCVKDHSNQQPPNTEFWQRLNSGFDWRSEWIDGGEYYEGDVVRFGDNSYVATSYHIADNGVNSPDIADSSEFWSVLAVGTEESVLTTQGDLVYYSGTAPTRLPIGRDGQLLQVSADGIPEWAYLDYVDDVYYVTENGRDEPAPVYGKSIDRPWRSIRYATKQIDEGARNPDAKTLIARNRRFIQRETVSWVDYQIDQSSSPFAVDFSYDSEKLERDIGLIVDALEWDVSHGGNVRSREAALGFIESGDPYSADGQEAEIQAAVNHALAVIESVLDQTDPDEDYQTLAGDNSTRTVSQYKDTSLTAESGVYADVQNLVKIITDAIGVEDNSGVPVRRIRNTLIRVSTGKYYEVLPIIVPAECCILGDELRSTRVEPSKDSNSTLTAKDDFRYHTVALDRLEQIIGDITEGVSVSASPENSLMQYQDWPVAETDWIAPEAKRLARIIRRVTDQQIGRKQEADFEPYYNMTDTVDGRGRDLVRRNQEFLQAEVVAYVDAEEGVTYYERTRFRNSVRDVLDAVAYDLTYGGNWQSVQAGDAFHEGSPLNSTITASAYTYLNEITKSVATGVEIVPVYQTAVEQTFGPASGDTGTANAIDSLFSDIIDIVNNGEGTVAITYPTVTNTDAQDIVNALDSAKSQIEDDSIQFINLNFPNLEYDQAKCERDIGLIIDAAKYDLALGTNFASIVAAYAYLRSSGEKVLEEQKKASIANLEFVRQRLRAEIPADTQFDLTNVSSDEFVSSYTNLNAQAGEPRGLAFNTDGTKMFIVGNNVAEVFQYTLSTGFDLSTGTYDNVSFDVSTEDTSPTDVAFNTDGTKMYIIASDGDAVYQYTLSTGFDLATASYDSVSLDVSSQDTAPSGLAFNTDGTKMFIVGAGNDRVYQYTLSTGFDLATASYDNVSASVRGSIPQDIEFNTDGTKMFTVGIGLDAVYQYKTSIEYDFARTGVDETFEWVSDIIFSGTTEGNTDQVEDIEVYNGLHQIKLNTDFIAEELPAYVADYFSAPVTAIDTTANTLTIDSTEWLYFDQPVQFTDDSTDVADAGLSEDNVYYVYDIVNDTEFKISSEPQGSELDLTAAWDGEFTVKAVYDYSETVETREIDQYLDALQWDLTWPQEWQRSYTGTAGISDFEIYRPAVYKTRLAARWYANSVTGSQEEDMYYLRNGTGLRLQTVAGLQGDLGEENEFGTRRPTAGAYASLDPGWGPADERVWITARSPYVQNLTTFGYAAIGQKIDGALHGGGNDSIVSNDFTQVISDGIGAWITNNGRAELVSVFSYYAHIGYLAETGGRIRATNGNNSYGTFGSVAEGVDPDETPVRAVVDNRSQFNATVANVFIADELLSFEYDHAGNDYTEAEIAVFGPGSNEEIVADEFRDGAVNRVKISAPTDPEDEAGGEGYTLVSNTAQQGSLTGIFLAATDGNVSSAYPGMKIYLVGGAGRGQYAVIDTYNAGSKEATVVKEDGTPGWEHVVPGSEIVAPNSTTTYQIEPRVEFAAPPVSSTDITVPSDTYVALDYVETAEIYTAVSATGGTGTGAVFDVTRVGSKYYVAVNTAGTGYERLDELTVSGLDLGGATPDNDITVLVLSLDSAGAITEFEFEGIGEKGFFFALPDSGQTAYTSVDGTSWNTTTLASNDTWNDVASGLLDDGSSLFKPDAVVIISGDGTANYSTDGAETWTASVTGLPTTGTKRIAFGAVGVDNNRFVVISDNTQDVAYTVDGGVNWTVVTDALGDTGYDSLTFGKGLFVATASGTNRTVYSEDGETWSAGSGLSSGDWTDIEWGNGRFVALTTDGDVAVSLDGKNWGDVIDTGATTTRSIAYGQGQFSVTTGTTEILYSEYGLDWTAETGLTTDYDAVVFGNPDRTGRFVAVGNGTTTAGVDFRAGARTKGRAGVSGEQIFEIRIAEPGSGYSTAPAITVTDPNNTVDANFLVRLGDGALANPTFVSRGEGYSEASAEIVDEESNGQADFLQDGDLIAVKRLTQQPVNGSNVEFDSLPGQFFKLVNTLSFIGDEDGSYTAFLQISPSLEIGQAPPDEDDVALRIRYSQVRLTGHDFLDIGTGNFEETNYPNEPEYQPDQTAETRDRNGGRVFFTATDQDGNFRVGDLFSIEQSTGIASINADAFNLAGLQELSLGEVTLGGNSATINEFSTDPFFTANSNQVVPTQRAVKAYIESQIGGGGASLNVNSVTAGDVFIGGDQITTVSGEPINIRANVVFEGTVLGIPLAYQYYLR